MSPHRRRLLKRIVLGLVAALALLVVVAAILFDRSLRGPPLPVCSAPPLPRKAFGAPLQLTGKTSPGVYGNEPSAALLPSGALAIAYQAHGGMFDGNGLSVLTVSPEGKVEERPFTTERKRHFDAWMTAAPDGALHLVWLGHDGGRPDKRPQIGHATSRDGLAWTPLAPAHDAAHDCPNEAPGCLDKPMVGWAKGALLVTYYSDPGGGAKAVRLSPDGKAEGPSVKVSEGAYGDLHISPSGVVHMVDAVWTAEQVDQYGDTKIHIELARSDDGGKTFQKPLRVSAEGESVPFYFSNAQVAFDEARGVIYVVYPTGKRDGGWSLALAASRDQGKTWRRATVNDDTPCANHMTPKAALDPKTGMLHVIWLENRTGKGGVAYSVCGPLTQEGIRCSPNEAVSDKPFASYTFARHKRDWMGEYPALVIDAERRALHAVWAEPVDEGGAPTSRIFYAKAALSP